MFIKWPPPKPILCAFIIELQSDVAIATSTADPPFLKKSLYENYLKLFYLKFLNLYHLPILEQSSLSAATTYFSYEPNGEDWILAL